MTPSSARTLILGSRSPRRLELLSHCVDAARIRVLTPLSEEEAGFDGLDSEESILLRLEEIARTKNEDVHAQLPGHRWGAVVTADTVVIVTRDTGEKRVLGKPDGPDWEQTTRDWFLNDYSGRCHHVATGVCIRSSSGLLAEFQVVTTVEFEEISSEKIEWYLQTREPLGKAGGYGLQGAGGIFVRSVIGSPSNVIGLPLSETWQALQQLDLL